MRTDLPSPPLDDRPRPGARAGLRAWWRGWSPLARDIAVVLVVKACVLWLLWFAFFRAPAAPRMTMEPQRVESRLFAPSPAKETDHAVR